MRGDFQEDFRVPDLPRWKEVVMSRLFGEVVGWLKAQGLIDGQEFATQDVPVLQCSKKAIWIDRVSPQRQIVWSFNSIRMEVYFGVADKTTKPMTVLHREAVSDLRYQISRGSEVALTQGGREKFDAIFESFVSQFQDLQGNGAVLL